MRELVFLPPWYPRLRRRRRLVMIQAWTMLLLCAALGGWLVMTQRSVQQAEASLALLEREQSQADVQLRKLDDLLALQAQWRHQDRVINELGLHIETTRLIEALDGLMSREMTLVELALEVVERPQAARPRGSTLRDSADPHDPRSPAVQRRFNVRLRGVAPTGVDLANFLTRLGEVPFFEQVNMSYSRDRQDNGHIMREFEVTFAVDLGARRGGS